MKVLNSHRGAVAAAVIVIALSVLFGFHGSATAARADVEAQFYSGADANGYSIAADLEDCLDITANLLSVAGRYLNGEALAGLEGSRRELEASLNADTSYNSIGNACRAYRRLAGEAETVLSALDEQALSEKDAGYVQGFRTDLAARADTIARNPYNQMAEEFNQKTLGVFPANLLRHITFVREAETFR